MVGRIQEIGKRKSIMYIVEHAQKVNSNI